ncbi:MAG: lysylphosphatidylglycerol synthase domain-containing protein, partial [Acidimicrobiales bacterium]
MRRWWGRLARLAVVAAVAAVLAKVAVDNAGALANVRFHLHPGWLVAAVPCSVASGLLLALGWRWLLIAWDAGIGPGAAIRIWWRSQASRYLPTGLFAVASREVLSARAGVPPSLGASSNVVELGILVAWGAVVAGALLPSRVLPLPFRVLVVVAGVAAVASLPWVLRLWSRLLPRRLLTRFPALTVTGLAPGALYRSAGLYAASIAAKSGAFTLVAAGMLAVHPGDAALLMGTVQGASVVGILGVTPAGIGVREGLMGLMLGPRFGLGDALALAVAWRAWELAFELVWLLVGAGVGV